MLLPDRPQACAILSRWPADADGDTPVRVLFASNPSKAHDLSFVALHASRVERSAGDAASAFHLVAKSVYAAPFNRGESGPLPARFTDRKKVVVADLPIAGHTLPADFENDPPDLRELYLRLDLASGRAWADPIPADHATDRAHARIQSLRKRDALEVEAAIVKAPSTLFEPGTADESCLVLVTFEPTAEVPKFLSHIARYLNSLTDGQFRDPDKADLAAMIADDRFVRYRRRALSESATDGKWVYACDLLVHRPFLRNGFLNGSRLTCLAEPGRTGRIELLPCEVPEEKRA